MTVTNIFDPDGAPQTCGLLGLRSKLFDTKITFYRSKPLDGNNNYFTKIEIKIRSKTKQNELQHFANFDARECIVVEHKIMYRAQNGK